MAEQRISEINKVASQLASDDYIPVDGATNGTRRMSATKLLADVKDIIFLGSATPSTNPTSFDLWDATKPAKVTAISASTDQTFTNFLDASGNAIVVPANTNAELIYNGSSWTSNRIVIGADVLQKKDINTSVVGVDNFNAFVTNGGAATTGTAPNVGYVNTTGGFTSNSAFKYSNFLPVYVGSLITYSLRMGNSSVINIAFYDANKVFVKAILVGTDTIVNTVKAGTWTADAVGYIVYCAGLYADGSDQSTLTITPKKNFATPTDVDTATTAATAAQTLATQTQTAFDTFKANGGSPVSQPAPNTGYVTTTGAFNSLSSFRYSAFIPVSVGTILNYSLRMGNSSVANIAFYDANKIFVKVLLAGTDAIVNTVKTGSITLDTAGYIVYCAGLYADGSNQSTLTTASSPSYATPAQMMAATTRITAIEQNTDTTPISNELVMPSKIWVINEYPLTFYKSSITRDLVNMKNKELVVACQDPNDDGNYNYPTYKSVVNDFQIDATKVLTSFLLFVKNYKVTASDYALSVAVQKVAKTAKDGQSLVWSCIGDSLTNRGTAYYTLKYLTAIGSTVDITNVGTMGNLGSKQGEGKEGWTTSNFIGADNIQHFGVGTITRPADNATGSSTALNPFLKLATDTDKANNPSFCFRNTGSATELSYSTDTDKTGNFYIFDYAWYLSARGLTTPTFVTIALGTNDFTVSGAAGVTSALTNLMFIVKQIRAALPTVKIGLISATGQGNNSTNLDLVFNFVNQLNTSVANLADANVSIIGSFASMNRNFMFPYGTASNLQTDGNQTKIYPKSEFIHFSIDGYKEYAKTIAPWILSL